MHFFVTLNLIQTNFGFIVCYDIDNVHIEVNIRGGSRISSQGADLKKLLGQSSIVQINLSITSLRLIPVFDDQC
jgi:hypothetical protein